MALKANGARPEKVRASHNPFSLGWSRSQKQAALGGLVAGAALVYVYFGYLRGGDVSPDSRYGYIFAVVGTLLLALVGIGYTLRKRWRRLRLGLLHTALSWHMVGGVLALALILMHAAGNFHPRTGTYALISLIALVVSGIIGKQLDRIAPRLAAKSALKTVSSDGEERLDALVGALDTKARMQAIQAPRRDRVAPKTPSDPWDLAYYDLSATADEIPSILYQPRPITPPLDRSGSEELLFESEGIREAIGMELLCLRLIRVWRRVHTVLSVLTLILILWHLEYAATLLLNAR